MGIPLLKTKLRNMFKDIPNLEFYLTNININGRKRGCSGFIHNKANDSIVYINTEISTGYLPPILYRRAYSLKDYKGDINNFCYPDKIREKVIPFLMDKYKR